MQSNECEMEVDLIQKLGEKMRLLEAQKEIQRQAHIDNFCAENRVIVIANAEARLKVLNDINCKFFDNLRVSQNSKKNVRVKCFMGARTGAANGIVQTAPAYVLSKSIRLPIMTSWVPLQHNFLVEDEEFLYNFPNLGDEVFDKDPNFNEHLARECFGGKVHEAETEKRVDDKLIVELIKSMGESEASQATNDTFPSQMLLEAVSQMYPSNGSPNKLRKMYMKHTRESYGFEDLTLEAESPIDECELRETDPVSPERFLSAYQKRFCRRCFIFGCFLHEPEVYTGPDRKKTEKPKSKPCSKECYLRDCVKQEPMDESNSKDDSALEADDVWTGSDQSIFRVLQTSFQNNYCAIARGLQNKTCKQVYEFAQKEMQDHPQEDQKFKVAIPKKRSKANKTKIQTPKLNKDKNQNTESSYAPCDHEGPCRVGCRCFDRKTFCEKYCKCELTCKNRFRGCECKGECLTNQCNCYIAFRECDPDVCRCGIHIKKSCDSDPSNRKKECKNVRIQRRLRKHLLLAPSDVAGWGMFIKDGAKRHEFIYEYCGEKITKAEASRREVIYTKFDCSFLFDLNEDYVIDATRKGNKIRFANHSKKPNCYVKILMVNGEHRIGVYADREIQPGEELFLSYVHGSKDTGFVGIEEKL